MFFCLFVIRVVESVGEGVTDLKLGDHVLPMFTGECGDCHHCRSEESNMCDLLQINTDRGVMINDGKSRFSINGKPIDHFVGTSTFSEYTIVHVGCLERSNQLCLSIEFVFSAAVYPQVWRSFSLCLFDMFNDHKLCLII